MQIAQTIQQQISAQDRMAFADWGAKEFVATKNGLQFTASGAVKFKGKVQVIYDRAQDLYTVEFFKIRNFEVKVEKSVSEVYADHLVSVIDRTVLGK